MYDVVYSFRAKEELERLSNIVRKQVLERVEKLKDGLWKGGSRVKKLQGVSRRKGIYEARIDKSYRMLFSVSPSSQALICIFNLYAKHDDVIRLAENILSESIDTEIYEKETFRNMVSQKVLLKETNYWPDQKYIYDYMDNLGKFKLSDEDLIRFMYSNNSGSFEEVNSRVYYTDQQEEIIKHPPPLLVAGVAGSGKTTVLIYKMLSEHDKKKLYITNSNKLCSEAKSLFLKLCRHSDNEEAFLKNTHFMSFNDLIIKCKKDSIAKVMTKNKFLYEYKKYARNKNTYSKFPPLMILEEIRSIWKRDIYKRDTMSLKEYIDMNDDEAPNFKLNREEAYKVFEWYQKLLADNYMSDELDLLQDTLEKVKEKEFEPYNLVLCDEAQDLTNAHFNLVFELAGRDANKIVFSGDDHQVVNFSGFKWGNLSRLIYNDLDNARPISKTLTKNWRNKGNIANLANEINNLQEKYVEAEFKTQQEEAEPTGEMPKVYENFSEQNILEVFCNLRPRDGMLVKDESNKYEVENSFASLNLEAPIIYTVEEAKGLEFSKVVLWKIGLGDEDVASWDGILRKLESEIEIKNNLERFVRHECSLIYTAITRGMDECEIYDGLKVSYIWKYPPIKKRLAFINKLIPNAYISEKPKSEVTKSKEVKEKSFSDKEWFNQGVYLFKKEVYEQSIKCFLRIKDETLREDADRYVIESQANIFMNNGEVIRAAELFLESRMIDEAIRCYEDGGEYEKISEIYRSYNYGRRDINLYNIYQAKHYESLEDWYKSAIFCKLSGNCYEAAVRFERAECYKEAAYWYKHEGAIKDYERCNK